MGFLRRLFGSGETNPPEVRAYVLPEAGYFEIAGVEHHKANLARRIPHTREGEDPAVYDDVPVSLRRDPGNAYDSNAVEVLLDDRLIGYIPRDKASAWSAFLAQLEAAGYRARATVRIRAGWSAYWVNLRADPDADYLMPEEEEARQAARLQADTDRHARREAQASERAARTTAREQARAEREQAKAIERERRENTPCRSCGNPVGPSTGPGRPPVYCADCRARRG